MIWLDNTAFDHPKLAGLSDAGVALWVKGLAYSDRFLSDGFVPAAATKVLTKKRSSITELVDRGLWKPTTTGYQIHDYLDHQLSKDEVRARRLQKQEAGRAGGIASSRRRQANAQANGRSSA